MSKLIIGNSMGRALLAAVGISEKNVLEVALDMGNEKPTSLVITRVLEVDDVAKLSGELQRIINAAEFRERVWTADKSAEADNDALRERLRGAGAPKEGDTHLTESVTPPAGTSRQTAMQWGAEAARRIKTAITRNG
jgi:hypothetical protein